MDDVAKQQWDHAAQRVRQLIDAQQQCDHPYLTAAQRAACFEAHQPLITGRRTEPRAIVGILGGPVCIGLDDLVPLADAKLHSFFAHEPRARFGGLFRFRLRCWRETAWHSKAEVIASSTSPGLS
jgi:hypothetical protein